MVILTEIVKNEYFASLFIILVSALLSKVIVFIIERYVHKFAEKTKTDIDDKILKIIKKPIYLLIILIGLNIALKTLTIVQNYNEIINKIFFVIYVLIITLTISKIITILILHWFKVKKKFERAPKLINKIINITIYVVALLIVLDYFKIDITPLIATLGIGALAIGLALQNTLSNLFAGLHILTDRPVNIGDFIEIGNDISGFVEDIGWRSTRIRTLPNTIIIIPNSKLAESVITNTSQPEQEMSVVIQCGVSYGSNLEKVEKVTIDVAKQIQKKVEGAVKKFEPFIRYHTFGESNIDFSIILRVEKPTNKYIIKHELIKSLKKRYDKEKIEISWPVRKIYHGK